jgi:hypothetical protein
MVHCSLLNGPNPFVNAAKAAVQCIWAVVHRQRVLAPIKLKPPLCNPVGDTASRLAEERVDVWLQ